MGGMMGGGGGGGGGGKAASYSAAFTRQNEPAPKLDIESLMSAFRPTPVMPTADGGPTDIVPMPVKPPMLPPMGDGSLQDDTIPQFMEEQMADIPQTEGMWNRAEEAAGGGTPDDETAAAIIELLRGGTNWAKGFKGPLG